MIKSFQKKSALHEDVIKEWICEKTAQALGVLSSQASKHKVLVVSVHTNSPEFAELQFHLLKKHMNDDFDFVVALDDVQDLNHLDLGRKNLDGSFQDVCTNLGIALIRIPTWIHHDRSILFPYTREKISGEVTNLRASDGLQYVFDVLPWQQYHSVLLLDADMFPIRKIASPDLSNSSPLFAVLQTRAKAARKISYFWNGIFWLHSEAPLAHLINFDCVNDRGLRADTGGQTFHLIQAYDNLGLEIFEMQHLPSGCWGEKEADELGLEGGINKWLKSDYRRRENGSYHAELYDGRFLHYRGGSNWSLANGANEIQNRASLAKALTEN